MFFKNISVLLSKNMVFLNQKKLKETMSRKESKPYAINFIDPWIIFLKNNFNTTNFNIFGYRIKRISQWEERICVQGL